MLDVAIIGAGPAGLSAALNVKLLNKNVALFSGDNNYLNRAALINNYLGFNKVSGSELMNCFLKHLETQGITPQKGRILNVVPFDNQFMLNMTGKIIEAKTVILATGIPKNTTIKGEDRFLGNGVSYCAACDGPLFKGKSVFVWGLCNEATEEANLLHNMGVKVCFVSEPKYQIHLKRGIESINGTIQEIIGDKSLESVRIKSKVFSTDAVFIIRSSVAPRLLVPDLEVDGSYIKTDKKMKTNIPGVYAAGDCVGKPLQIAKAVAEGLIAAQEAVRFLDKNNL